MIEFSEWYRKQSSPVGMLQVGGGIAGDFPICVVPLLNQDMGMDVPKWQWFAKFRNLMLPTEVIQAHFRKKKYLGENST